MILYVCSMYVKIVFYVLRIKYFKLNCANTGIMHAYTLLRIAPSPPNGNPYLRLGAD